MRLVDSRPQIYFRLFVKDYLETKGRGSSKVLAKQLNIRPSYLSDLVTGKRAWSDKMKDKVMRQTNTRMSDILRKGEFLYMLL